MHLYVGFYSHLEVIGRKLSSMDKEDKLSKRQPGPLTKGHVGACPTPTRIDVISFPLPVHFTKVKEREGIAREHKFYIKCYLYKWRL